jgi:inner membrane protein
MPFTPVQIWAIIGMILIIADVFGLTFFLFFLGIGAFATSVSTWLGLTPGLWGQFACFALSFLVATLLFRRALRKMCSRNAGPGEYSEYAGQRALVSVAIPAGGEGRVTYGGSEWPASSGNGGEILAGTAVVIAGLENITFRVNPQG